MLNIKGFIFSLRKTAAKHPKALRKVALMLNLVEIQEPMPVLTSSAAVTPLSSLLIAQLNSRYFLKALMVEVPAMVSWKEEWTLDILIVCCL